jgi:hypothetical protein
MEQARTVEHDQFGSIPTVEHDQFGSIPLDLVPDPVDAPALEIATAACRPGVHRYVPIIAHPGNCYELPALKE